MELQDKKCVMVIDGELPLGFIANTAGIMGITLGKYIPDSIGPDVTGKDGSSHLGIIQIPVPVLKADKSKIKTLRKQLSKPDFSDVIVVDFSNVAQSCNIYDEFMERFSLTEECDIDYFGIGIFGPKKLVNKLTGSLPLMR